MQLLTTTSMGEESMRGLTELEAVGDAFTWCNGFGSNHTCSKIDRAYGNDKWMQRWSHIRSMLLFGNTSDQAS